jgi:PAS domain S-box-containing protein
MRLGKMGSWETDFAQGTRTWSAEAVALFDLPSVQGIVGGDQDELVGAMHPEDKHLVGSYHQHLLTHDEVDAEYRIVLRDGTVRHVAGRGLVISRQSDGRPHILINVVTDVTERAKVEEHLSEYTKSLAASKARFEALVEATAQIVWSATALGEIAEDSPSWRAFTGQSEHEFLGLGWLAAIHPDDREHTLQAWQQAVETRRLYQIDYRLRHVTDGYRWTRARGVPLLTQADTVVEWVGMNEDIDERVKRNDQLATISKELSHRTKNLLAVVQSVARRTFRNEVLLSSKVNTFLNRVQSLAVSHDLLVHGNWSGVLLEDLVREHLKPFMDVSTLDIEGPPIHIAPSAAQNLGLALHELATNAAKYGALKARAGKLQIRWNLNRNAREDMFEFRWSEQTTLADPLKGEDGFGSQLLDRIVGASLSGKTDFRLTPHGVEWRLVAPLDSVVRNPLA